MAVDFSKFRATPEEESLFDKAPFDKEAGRKKLVDRIARALKQFNGEQGKQGGSDFEIGYNNQIRYRPTLNGHRIKLADEADYFPTTSAKFAQLLSEFSKAADNGEYDDQIEAALSAPAAAAPVRRSRSTGNKSSGEKPWAVRKNWASLSKADKQSIGRYYSNGKNPDGSVIAEVGHKPDAPLVRAK